MGNGVAAQQEVLVKIIVGLLVVFCLFLGLRLLNVESELASVQRNTAIAILSAEAANTKAGAIAPYFSPDKEAFVKAWIDSVNMPPAVFPEHVLVPLKQELERKRSDPNSQKALEAAFK
jgi:hypothetical protein